jgi:hypothetical protein
LRPLGTVTASCGASLPALALDPARHRLAVADDEAIHVVEIAA